MNHHGNPPLPPPTWEPSTWSTWGHWYWWVLASPLNSSWTTWKIWKRKQQRLRSRPRQVKKNPGDLGYIYIYIINHCFLDPYERTRMTHGKYPAWLIGWNINSPWVVGWVKNSYMDGGWNGAPINGRKWMGSWGSCLGYMSGMKSYPVMWGLWQKPWNKDPIIKQFLAVHFLTSLGWPGGRMVVNDLFRRLLFLGLGGIGMYWVYVYIYIYTYTKMYI